MVQVLHSPALGQTRNRNNQEEKQFYQRISMQCRPQTAVTPEIVVAGISTSQHIQQASFLFPLPCKGEKQTLVICHFFSYQLEVPP
jgi:hypothetical protein